LALTCWLYAAPTNKPARRALVMITPLNVFFIFPPNIVTKKLQTHFTTTYSI
jgi:hypothetical protein